jgi:hypothetical protein
MVSSVELRDKQDKALALTIAGKTPVEIGDAIGVAQSVVLHWREHDYGFRESLDTHRRALWDAHHDRLLGMASKAIDSLETLLESEDETTRLRAISLILAFTARVDPELPCR